MITFTATRKKVEARTTSSLDTEVQLVLITEQTSPLQLGLDPADTLYKITIERVE